MDEESNNEKLKRMYGSYKKKDYMDEELKMNSEFLKIVAEHEMPYERNRQFLGWPQIEINDND